VSEAGRLLAVAVQFLTRLPVPAIRVDDGDLRRASMFFPAIGLLVAAIGVGVRAGSEWALGSVPATVLAVAAMVAATGAFHEDGLADTVDGLWGGWSPQERIAIMRDSRIGTYGTVAIVASLGLRVALLAGVDLLGFARLVFAGHVTGRAAGLVMAAVLPAASDQGHGAQVAGPLAMGGAAVAAVTTLAVLATVAGFWLWAPLLAAAVVVAAMRRLVRRRLGGVTGDVLGATNQMAHLAAMAALAAVLRGGAL
jgi:adenosylcobinamide-GDP ribazoletransferase